MEHRGTTARIRRTYRPGGDGTGRSTRRRLWIRRTCPGAGSSRPYRSRNRPGVHRSRSGHRRRARARPAAPPPFNRPISAHSPATTAGSPPSSTAVSCMRYRPHCGTGTCGRYIVPPHPAPGSTSWRSAREPSPTTITRHPLNSRKTNCASWSRHTGSSRASGPLDCRPGPGRQACYCRDTS